MISWKNLDASKAFAKLQSLKDRVDLVKVMSGENGAKRAAEYSVPMAAGLNYNYAAKAVDKEVLDALCALASETQLIEKFAALYNGEIISLRHFQNDVKEMKSGMECGIRLDNFADFVPGDRIEAYDIELKKASL